MESGTWQKDSWHLAVRIILLITAIIALYFFIKNITWVISLLVISTLIVYSLSPISAFLKKIGVPNTIAVLFVFSLFFSGVFLFFYLLVPTLIVELRELGKFITTDYRYLLPDVVTQVNNLLEIESINQALQNFAQEVPTNLQAAVISLTNLTKNLFSRLSEVVIVLFMVFYLMRDLSAIKRGIIRVFPGHLRKEATLVFSIIDQKVGAYLRGNILRCLIVGLLTVVALFAIDMPFALMLGILAGLLNIIVYVGPYLAGIPAVILALAPNTPNPLVIVAIYVAIQGVEAFFLTPLLLGKAVDLMPFSVIVSLLIGGRLFGFLGLLLAIPVAATLKVLIFHYVHGDDDLLPKRRPPQVLTAGYQTVKERIHQAEHYSFAHLILDLLAGAGLLLIISPLLLYWFAHSNHERYQWMIEGPFPINQFGSSPFWLTGSIALAVPGLLLIVITRRIKKYKQSKK